MALTKLTADVENVSALSDLPNDQDGLTPAELKAVFDAGNVTIKNYINNTLTEEIEGQFDDTSYHTGRINLAAEQTTWVMSVQEELNVKTTSVVYCVPHDGSEHEWNSCGIKCNAQTENGLAFTAVTAPTTTVGVDVFVLNN